nr:hypothetical protein [Tanacetum cinerariifolium]
MAALVISISLDVSVKSVGSSFSRVILIGFNSVEVPVAPEVGTAAVASPAGVLELDTYSSIEADPSKSSPPPMFVAPMVSPFCVQTIQKNPTAPILPAPSTIVAPSSEFSLASVVSPPEIRQRQAILIRPGKDIPISRLYHTYLGGLCRALTVRKSVRPLHSHHLVLRSALLSTMYPPTTSESSARDSSSKLSVGPSRKRCRSHAATMTSSIYATRALVPFRVDLLPPRKRFGDSISPEDSIEEDIDTDVLKDIETDATAIEIAVDRDVVTGVDAGIDMEVDVGVDVEDEVESSDRGIMKVEEGLQDIYKHVIELPLQRIKEIEMGNRELEARSLIAGRERASLLDQVVSLERSNARL